MIDKERLDQARDDANFIVRYCEASNISIVRLYDAVVFLKAALEDLATEIKNGKTARDIAKEVEGVE